MVRSEPAADDVRAWLAAVADPEIPVISILDLGIVRDVSWIGSGDDRRLRVAVTPTYSGCPALRQIERDIVALLCSHGVERVEIAVRLQPAWTTDWLSADARERLRAYGIAPPSVRAPDPAAPLDLFALASEADAVRCPRCGTTVVELVSRFGSTACKAHYRCTLCREPFDHFKAH